MLLPDSLLISWNFIKARWIHVPRSSRSLKWRQKKSLKFYLKYILPRAPYYQANTYKTLDDIPIMDKDTMRINFSALNTVGITLEEALNLTQKSEKDRDFAPKIGQISAGLSSGTSGKPGLFLASDQERLSWAGIMMAKVLSTKLLLQIVNPFHRPLEIAFFLRANNNLYETISGKRLHLQYYDITQAMDFVPAALNKQKPDILVAPASILAFIARLKIKGAIDIFPDKIISVAEVLEDDDNELISKAFRKRVEQIYQATEGFIGYTCPHGSIHLNETYIMIEKEWIDEKKERFYPIITDFSRSTQIFARYRMNDILHISNEPCVCGSHETKIQRIEGRSDDVLHFDSINGSVVEIYPDILRRKIMMCSDGIEDYRIEQNDDGLEIKLFPDNSEARKAITTSLLELWNTLNIKMPILIFAKWEFVDHAKKRRRIVNKIRSKT